MVFLDNYFFSPVLNISETVCENDTCAAFVLIMFDCF